MKITQPSMHSSLFVSLMLLAGIVALSSCTKEAKNSTALQAVSVSESSSSDRTLPPGIDSTKLVAWYDFNGGSLKDRSIYHNNIKFSNAQLTTDRKGIANNAYYFDGASYMRVANSPSLNPDKAITMFAIIKVADFYEGKCHGNRIIDKSLSEKEPGFYYLGFDDHYYTNFMNCSQNVDKLHQTFESGYGDFSSTTFNTTTDTTQFIQQDQWYHIVYTYEKGTGKLYVNGMLVQTDTKRAIFTPNRYDLYIGTLNKKNLEYPYYFTGTIDQIAIFNVALTQEQVAKLSNY